VTKREMCYVEQNTGTINCPITCEDNTNPSVDISWPGDAGQAKRKLTDVTFWTALVLIRREHPV